MKKQVMNKRHTRFAGLLAMGMILFLAGSVTAVKKTTNPIYDLMGRLELGPAVVHGRLTVVPVYADGIGKVSKYVTLEEALKRNWVDITEMDGGRVPQVRISNRSRYPVFIMGGEILTGCKQDRILAQDVLLAPHRRNLIVPVYCVEQGRWTHSSDKFYSKSNLGTPGLRAKALTRAPEAQAEIWSTIGEQNRKMGVSAPTGAFQAAFDSQETVAAIRKVENRVIKDMKLDSDVIGVVIGLGGRVASMDVFADSRLFKKQWPKILKSAALSSLQTDSSGHLSREKAAEFLRSFLKHRFVTRPALDLGYELAVSGVTLQAGALVYKNAIMHLAGFPGRARIAGQDRLPVIRR